MTKEFMIEGFDVKTLFSDKIIEKIHKKNPISESNILVIPEKYEEEIFRDMEVDSFKEAMSKSHFIRKSAEQKILIEEFFTHFNKEKPKEIVSLKKLQDIFHQDLLKYRQSLINRKNRVIPNITSGVSNIISPFMQNEVFLELIKVDEYIGESFLDQQDIYFFIYAKKQENFMDFLVFYIEDGEYFDDYLVAIKPVRIIFDCEIKFSEMINSSY